MKKVIVLLGLLITTSANAAEFTGSYDYYKTPNGGNNYDDGQGYSLGVRHEIAGDVSGRLDFSHITDIHFASPEDVKGSWGELRGYGASYSVIYNLPYSDKLSFNIWAGLGYFSWKFNENPHLQDNHVDVSVEPSLVYKAGIGAEHKLNEAWTLDASLGWMDTTIEKVARDDSGQVWNILDAGNELGLQFITFRIGVKKRF